MDERTDNSQSSTGKSTTGTESQPGNRDTIGGTTGKVQSIGEFGTGISNSQRINGSVTSGDSAPGSEDNGAGKSTNGSENRGTAPGFEWTRGIDRGRRYSGRGRPRGSATRTTTSQSFREDIPTGVKPEAVSVQDLFNEQTAKGKDSNTADLLADLIQAVFKAPCSMGYGQHWILPRDDAKDISTKLLKCLKTLPNSKITQKIINQWSPWVALILTLFAILQPRIELSQELKRVGKLGYTVQSVRANGDTTKGQTSNPYYGATEPYGSGSVQDNGSERGPYNPAPDSGLFE